MPEDHEDRLQRDNHAMLMPANPGKDEKSRLVFLY